MGQKLPKRRNVRLRIVPILLKGKANASDMVEGQTRNYINTSTALGANRLAEIGIRKVMGGNRKMIIIQFLIENIDIVHCTLFGDCMVLENNTQFHNTV